MKLIPVFRAAPFPTFTECRRTCTSWHARHSLKARVVLWLAPVVYDDNRRVGLLGNCFDKINKRPTGLDAGIRTARFTLPVASIQAFHRSRIEVQIWTPTPALSTRPEFPF